MFAKSGAWATAARQPVHYQAVHKNNVTSDGRRNNLYSLAYGGSLEIAQNLANSFAYRQHFYDFYIGLNYDTAHANDDVIVRANDGGYYTPGSSDAWKVDYSRIPISGPPLTGPCLTPAMAFLLGPVNLRMPTPNWQCGTGHGSAIWPFQIDLR
jgi:hypothetical protein